jgi:hypothetical protein
MARKYILLSAVILLAALWASACHASIFSDFGSAVRDDKEHRPRLVAPAPESTVRTLTGAFNASKAVELLYGNIDPETKRARWQPTQEELKLFGLKSNIKMLYTRVLFAGEFTERGQPRYFLLTKTTAAPEECRACAPFLGGATYTKVGDRWQPDNESRFIARMNTFDKFVRAKVVKLGAQKHGVLFHWSFTNLGFTEEGNVLVAEFNQGLKELFALVTAGNNEADCDPSQHFAGSVACWSYKSKLEFVPSANPDFYDLKIITRGTKPNEEGVVTEFAKTKTYVFINGRYVPRRTRPRQR